MRDTRSVPRVVSLFSSSKWFLQSFSILLLLLAVPAFGQKITGDISGDVTDSSGAVLPNVNVTVANVDTGVSRSVTTNATGNYRVPELPVGSYKVTAAAPGFKTLVQNASVVAGGVIHADFKLPVGERTEEVEIQGEAPLVDLSPNNNNYVDSQKIESVPLNGRDFNSLLAITPGVQRAPGGGFLAISINGSRTTSNNYFIDGLYNNDRYYGDSAINETGIVGIPAVEFPPEAIEELSVQGTPSSEFGVKGGAPILLNMKSGTNNWHGSGTWVNHSGFGDANNYFANHTFDNCGSPGECQPTNIHNNQMNGTLGGPIIKDKAFFFLYYDGQRYKSLSVSARKVPTPAEISAARADIAANGLSIDPVGDKLLSYFPTSPTGLFTANTPTTASSNGFGVKFDYHLNSSNSIAVRYIFGDSFQSAPPFAGLPAGGGHAADLFNSVAPSRAQMAGVSWTTNFGNNKILESRLGYTRFAQLLGINNKIDPKALGIDTGPLSPADFGVPYVYMYHLGYGGYIGGVQGYPLITRPDATWDWSEHFSWVKGNHNIKFGGNFQRAYTNSTRNDARTGMTLGYFSYYAPINASDPVQDDVEQLLLGKADVADRSFGDTHRHITQNSVGFYLQDDWKIKSRLTVSYGLRYDINGTMRDTNNLEANFIPGRGLVQVGQGISGIHNVDYHDVGPHVGFAWDVYGNGKIAVRGGYSRSFDVANFGALASPYSFAHARTGVFTQPNLNFFNVSPTSDVASGGGSLLPPNDPSTTCYDPVTKTGDYICFDAAKNGPLFGADPSSTPPFNAFSVVQNFKTPHYDNFNLSVQTELFRNNVLTLAYVGQRGGDLIIYHDLNASPVGSDCVGSGCDPLRPFATTFPTLEHVIQATNQGKSQYDSLQITYNQRAWHGLDTQYNLTWGKCFDMNSVNRGGAGDYPQLNNINPVGSTAPAVANFGDSWGNCDHDVRLNFNAGGLYAFPTLRPLGERLGGGWQLSTIFTAIGGRPFTALLSGSDNSGQGLSGASIRASYDGTPIKYNTRNPDQYVVERYTAAGQADPCGDNLDSSGNFLSGFPLSPFYFPCTGTVGNSPRNVLRGPGLIQWDLSLIKATKITERLNMQIRWEVFNVLNRGNFFYFPNNVLTTCGTVIAGNLCSPIGGGNFSQIDKTSDVAAGNPVIAQGGPRNMNFSLKFIF
ncbi:MAG TPA: TonB-dependent receptor [Terriglobales bacterium]|nr:TonB-dependent receptor [Terriglobales bacterium]